MYRLTLMNAGWDIAASQSEKYGMVIDASTGEKRFEELLKWTEQHLVKAKP
jgi:death-on-curing protein